MLGNLGISSKSNFEVRLLCCSGYDASYDSYFSKRVVMGVIPIESMEI